jgi:predicted DCC family thiol-disulfide oxidoreductase YuxK
MERHLLLYDEECGVCRASVRAALRMAPAGTLAAAGLRSPIADRGTGGQPLQERLRSFHLIAPDGRHWQGPEALPPLFDLVPRLRRLARLLRRSPPASRLASAGYGWISRHRPLLGRFLPHGWAEPLPQGPDGLVCAQPGTVGPGGPDGVDSGSQPARRI